MIPAKKTETGLAPIEEVLMKGDLSSLSEPQRLEYYQRVCRSLGLNPLTRPFDYLVLNGKLQLYARRDAADQLRKINGISIEDVTMNFANGLLTVRAHAHDRDGRTDEDYGVVPFGENLKGEFAANMTMKAITKAKRRVTLSICGLGFLDETEVEDIPGAVKHTAPTPEQVIAEQKTQAKKLTDAKKAQAEPHKLSVPLLANNAGPDFRAFATHLLDVMRGCPEMADIFEWQQENQSTIDEMQERVPKMHESLLKAIGDITSAAT